MTRTSITHEGQTNISIVPCEFQHAYRVSNGTFLYLKGRKWRKNKMKKKTTEMSLEELNNEIETLKNDDYVQLAKLENRLKYKKQQYLYQLRWQKKRGEELRKQGITEKELYKKYEC